MRKVWTYTFLLTLQLESIRCNQTTEPSNLDGDLPKISQPVEKQASVDHITSSEFTTSDDHSSETFENLENSRRLKEPLKAESNEDTQDQKAPVYFDITEALNTQNLTEIQSILNHTAHVYYKTDRSLTALKSLDWVADRLHSYSPNQQLFLTLAFQLTTNRTDLNWQHIEDYLLRSAAFNVKKSKQTPHFRNYLCRIVLDFQLGNRQLSLEVNDESFVYLRKADMSFAKYTKKILKEVFKDKKIPVGVVYNEMQLEKGFSKSFRIIHNQEIQHADFLLVNVDHSPIVETPLTYNLFKKQYAEISLKNERHLATFNSTKKHSIQYMVTWNNWDKSTIPQKIVSDYEAVVNSSSHRYLNLIQKYVAVSVKRGNIDVGVISGTNFNLKDANLSKTEESTLVGSHVFPYLNLRDNISSVCNAKLMINRLAKTFKSMAVNEFTWSALGSASENLTSPAPECSNLNEIKVRGPRNVILLASNGTRAEWNLTKERLISLAANYYKVAGMYLDTIVIPGENLAEKSDTSNDTETLSYADSVKESNNKTGVGCIADFSAIDLKEPNDILTHTQQQCESIMEKSTVFVWKFVANFSSTSDKLTENNFDARNVTKALFTMLAAKNSLNDPDLKLIFQIQTVPKPSSESNDVQIKEGINFQTEIKRVLLRWAKIHKVKLLQTLKIQKL